LLFFVRLKSPKIHKGETSTQHLQRINRQH